MVNLANTTIALLILLVFGISLLNPGGAIVAAVIAGIVLGLYMTVPFMQDYVLSVNKGKAARKEPDAMKDNGGDGRK